MKFDVSVKLFPALNHFGGEIDSDSARRLEVCNQPASAAAKFKDSMVGATRNL
jgi:hypothetical protein